MRLFATLCNTSRRWLRTKRNRICCRHVRDTISATQRLGDVFIPMLARLKSLERLTLAIDP